jgi:uncharacterized membrane protein (DUF2068 family)
MWQHQKVATTHPPVKSDLQDLRTSNAGLRAVASFEAFKGVAVVLLGLVLLLYHSHAEDLAETMLDHLHIDEDKRIGQLLMHAASQVSDARLWTIAGAVITYSTVRFVEAWGLWHRRIWAEWFALLSGAMYLPWEFLKVAQRATPERVIILVINVIIVLYMLFIRLRERGAPLSVFNS